MVRKRLSQIWIALLALMLIFMSYGPSASARAQTMTTNSSQTNCPPTSQPVSRLDFAKEMNPLFSFTEETKNTINDVTKGTADYKTLSLAVQAGYLTLDSNGDVRPNAPLTRAEAVRALNLLYGVSDSKPDTSYGFTDISTLNQDTQVAINAFAAAGYLSSLTTQKVFIPEKPITNSELSSLLDQLKKSNWKLNWNDEFTEPTVDPTKWTYDLGTGGNNPGWGNNELENYTNRPDNVKTQNGDLVITAKKESYQGSNYTSARLKTQGLFAQKYGKFEIRAKLPTGKGLWPAIWMLPNNPQYGAWAASGEIDIMELHGSDPSTVAGTIHYGATWPSNVYTGKSYTLPNNGTAADWHTYGLEWTPGQISWTVDGKVYETQNNWYSHGLNQPADYAYPAPFDQPFEFLLNLAVGGNFDGNPDAKTQFPAQMKVDYVRAYQMTQPPTTQPQKPVIAKDPIPANAIPAESDGNLIRNSNFDENTPDGVPTLDNVPKSGYWSLFQGASIGVGGTGNVTLDPINGSNFAKINITDPGSQNYSVQLLHQVSLVKGHYYKLTFDAKSSQARDIDVKFSGGADRGYAAYSKVLGVSLTDQVKQYTLAFQMTQDTDVAARLEFNAGTNANPVWIGNVKLVETDGLYVDQDGSKPPLAGDGNQVYNGTFDEGDTSRMIFWHFNTAGTAQATASVDPNARELNVAIDNPGSTSNDITLVQKGMQLINGQTYQLSFDGKAAAARNVEVAFLSKDGTTEYFKKSIALGTSMGTQTVSFTMPKDVTDKEGQLVFRFGGDKNDVTLDNVKLIRTSMYIDPSVKLFPLENGDFDTTIKPWQVATTDGGAATATKTDTGQAKITVTNSGNQPYSNMFMQDGLSLSNGITYDLEFDAHSSIARQMELDLEDSSYTRYFDQTVNLTQDDQHFKFEFTMTQDKVVALKFFLGKIAGDTGTDQQHDVYIDNVDLEVKGATQMANMLKNGTFDTDLSNWSPWLASPDLGSVTQDNGQLKASLNSNGANPWDIQIPQNNLTFEQGKSYRVKFDARSTVSRTMQVVAEQNGGAYTKYLTKNVPLTDQMKTYTTTFTMTGATDSNAHLNFLLGNIDGAITQAHDVYIDNVSIVEVNMPPVAAPAGHALLNGGFDTNTDNWGTYLGDGSDATFNSVNGALEVNFPDYDGWNRWSTQIYQDGLHLEQGKTYELSFDANNTKPTDKVIGVEIQNSAGGDHLATTNFTLTSDMKTYTVDFTPTANDENAKLLFLLGGSNLDGKLFTKNSKIHLDNVTLTEKTTASPTTTTVTGTVASALATNTLTTSQPVTLVAQSQTTPVVVALSDSTDNKCSSNGNSSTDQTNGGSNPGSQPIIHNGKVTFNSDAFNNLSQNGQVFINLGQSTDFSIQLTKDQVHVLKSKSGHLLVTNHDVTIDFPTSNLPDSGDVQFNVQKMKDMGQAYSGVYNFTIASGATLYHHFLTPVTLTFKINQTNVPNPDQLKVYYYNEQTKKWELIGGTYKNGTVTTTTSHFSTYTVFRQAASTTSKSSSQTGSPQLPNTGTPYYNFLVVGALLIILGGIAVIVRRRQQLSK